MPYVEGESLRDRLRRECQLPLADALQIATEVARTLDFAHQHGVVHRDIKPENLLLTTDGSTLVADFGIARALGETGDLTETGIVVRTPTYMSLQRAGGPPTICCGGTGTRRRRVRRLRVGGPPHRRARAAAVARRDRAVRAGPGLRRPGPAQPGVRVPRPRHRRARHLHAGGLLRPAARPAPRRSAVRPHRAADGDHALVGTTLTRGAPPLP